MLNRNQAADLLRQIPVSVNNYYGDPTLQWPDTLAKLEDLIVTGHVGPVGVILKGRLTPRHCREFASYQARGLKLVVFVSISELRDMERVGAEHRYENIRHLREAGVPAVGYVRPLTPPYNTSAETIDKIFRRLGEVECEATVVAGFRGDDHLVAEMQPADVVKWVIRVKQMTPQIWQDVYAASQRHHVQLFTRTSCAVDYLLGNRQTYNPYFTSPQLVKCAEVRCPLRATCGKGVIEPREGSLEFLRHLGYEVEFQLGTTDCHAQQFCNIEPHNRLDCKSCCTTCFMLRSNPHIEVSGKVNLGDLTFIRFISGVLASQPGCRDTGALDVGSVCFPKFPHIEGIQCLNSWWPIARVGRKCFDCKYCIEKYYGSTRTEIGFSPVRLLDLLEKGGEQ
jgi:hypothetical protein